MGSGSVAISCAAFFFGLGVGGVGVYSNHYALAGKGGIIAASGAAGAFVSAFAYCKGEEIEKNSKKQGREDVYAS